MHPGDASVLNHFKTLEDPSVEHTRRHSRQDILVIAICGMDNSEELRDFGLMLAGAVLQRPVTILNK
jgi:hypothetical protein